MKIKFILIVFLLLFARGCDFYSTGLWFFERPEDEINPLVRILGFGWTGLIISNAILVALIIYCFYYYSYKYSPGKVLVRPATLTDYVSQRYYNKPGKFYQVFYKMPLDKKTRLGHAGYIVIRVAIVASFLATIHNLCLFYNLSFYNRYLEIVGRPLSVLFGLVLLSIIWFSYRIWKKEFENARKDFDKDHPVQYG
jgi:hypothetical protein